MFDLDQAVADWRRQMVTAGIKTPEVLDELETHLREDLEERIRSGSSVQEAFDAAVRQMGQACALREEFEKVCPTGSAVSPRYLWIICLVSAPFTLLVSAWALLTGEVSLGERWWGMATISAIALYLCVLPRWHRRFPSPQGRWVQAVLHLGNVFFIGLPLLALAISLELVPIRPGIAVEMVIGAAYVAAFATWVGYAVRDPSALTGSGNGAAVRE